MGRAEATKDLLADFENALLDFVVLVSLEFAQDLRAISMISDPEHVDEAHMVKIGRPRAREKI